MLASLSSSMYCSAACCSLGLLFLFGEVPLLPALLLLLLVSVSSCSASRAASSAAAVGCSFASCYESTDWAVLLQHYLQLPTGLPSTTGINQSLTLASCCWWCWWWWLWWWWCSLLTSPHSGIFPLWELLPGKQLGAVEGVEGFFLWKSLSEGSDVALINRPPSRAPLRLWSHLRGWGTQLAGVSPTGRFTQRKGFQVYDETDVIFVLRYDLHRAGIRTFCENIKPLLFADKQPRLRGCHGDGSDGMCNLSVHTVD